MFTPLSTVGASVCVIVGSPLRTAAEVPLPTTFGEPARRGMATSWRSGDDFRQGIATWSSGPRFVDAAQSGRDGSPDPGLASRRRGVGQPGQRLVVPLRALLDRRSRRAF